MLKNLIFRDGRTKEGTHINPNKESKPNYKKTKISCKKRQRYDQNRVEICMTEEKSIKQKDFSNPLACTICWFNDEYRVF